MIGKFTSSPEFNAHREGVTAADVSLPTKAAAGVNARGFRWALIDVVKASGTITDLDLQIYFWSEAADAFVPSNDSAHTVTNLTDSIRFAVPVYGQVFWVNVDALTGTSPEVEIHVAGYGEPSAF